MPAMIASRDSFAPCMKNSSAIARLVMSANTVAASPRHGSRLARITVDDQGDREAVEQQGELLSHGAIQGVSSPAILHERTQVSHRHHWL